MKLATPTSIVALILATTSLILTVSRPSPKISDAELDRLVDAALARKERIYVAALAPKMDLIYKDMLGSKYTTPAKAPETLGELFVPALQVINAMGASH